MSQQIKRLEAKREELDKQREELDTQIFKLITQQEREQQESIHRITKHTDIKVNRTGRLTYLPNMQLLLVSIVNHYQLISTTFHRPILAQCVQGRIKRSLPAVGC